MSELWESGTNYEALCCYILYGACHERRQGALGHAEDLGCGINGKIGEYAAVDCYDEAHVSFCLFGPAINGPQSSGGSLLKCSEFQL